MLFDLRGKGRRRTIQVIYVSLALLMGGRSSRAWNKPIVMESILRGADGRIAAYQRVRLHCSTRVAVVGFAAEGVMHLLAELADNAANFSPPTDEVHVYVEESRTGIVITIEDSGLRMSEAAQRRAEESVSGRMTDLALLQGTRLGLAVVGPLLAPLATAGLALMETGSGSEADLDEVIDRLLPRDDRYRHRHGSPGHGADHLMPVLVSPSLVLPVVGGRPALGAWQSVVLVDPNSDNRSRTVRLSFLPG